MLHRNGKEIEQIFRNNREIALLYKNGVIIYDKRRKSSPGITITYKSRNLSGDQVFTTESGDPAVLTITSSVPTWNNHTLVGWSTNEWDYDNYLSAGESVNSDSDLTLYAVWSTTVQGLIDEGYCTLSTETNHNLNQKYTISANNYPENQVTDFIDYLEGRKGISGQTAVTIDGTNYYENAFIWASNHWLTDARIAQLYSEHTVVQYFQGVQFPGVNFRENCPNLTMNIKTNRGSWMTDNCIFNTYSNTGANSPNCAENLTLNVTGGGKLRSGYRFLTGASNLKTLTITTDNSDGILVSHSCSALFENCTKLTTINGCIFNSYLGYYGPNADMTDISYMFSNCGSIVTIPSTIAKTGIIYVVANANAAFRNCSSLTTIEPIIDMQYCAQGKPSNENTENMFKGCSLLTSLQLKNINSDGNGDIDLSETVINQTSADYIVTNVYENVDTSADGFVYKNIYFPATVTITQAQAARLYQYGWNCYVNGNEMLPAA